ncbi:hypothetical protein M501DRAFT_1027849 [Patellaria atrata CBS 101060]|uniref:Uncharacterized protein n=1 Tax=Patellaria atrata CBS 101060 TaxID=1346257 RepID=A0A9P4SJK9_9PEZI|nr:hypothetical protein M501DRAFT_1027849 [Patellaria atrata CBS 101060]
MVVPFERKLHWTQRVALIRHNLHAARRTGNFTFFKTLQAYTFLEGADHVATLNASLGDDADMVLSTLDNLNAGIAYTHQDAFKSVYDSAKAGMMSDADIESRKGRLRVDISQQRETADHAIDKMANSVVALIEQQPAHCREDIANAWITGATIVVDAVEVCLVHLASIESYMDDFIHLEYAWNTVQSAADAAISALRGVFSLMNSGSRSAGSIFDHERSRASSIASTPSQIFRRFSTVLSHTPSAVPTPQPQTAPSPGPRPSRANSISSVPSLSALRASVSAACPTRIPHTSVGITHTQLAPIPPTPAAVEDLIDPFDMTSTTELESYFKNERGSLHQMASTEMEIEPADCRVLYPHPPGLFRRLSSAFAPPIAV